MSATAKINYLYDAVGTKVKKTVTSGVSVKVTDYLSGFQYVDSVLEFFPTAEGYVKHTPSGNPFIPASFNYVYNYTDHLGNIRLSYTLDPEDNVLKILEENHYYPFGLKHKGYSDEQNIIVAGNPNVVIVPFVENTGPRLSVTYKYKYNGKEFQDELGLNMYDYGARNYDPAIGRWMNIDPLAEKYYSLSPYVYALNRPTSTIDPDGRYTLTGEAAQSFVAGLQRELNDNDKGKSTGVIKNKNGTYTVVSGKADGDKGVYIADSKGNYNKKSTKIGNSVSDSSFLNDKGKAVKGAVINTKSNEVKDFLQNEVIDGRPPLWYYLARATGGGKYDLKSRGLEEAIKNGLTPLQHRYRGSMSLNGEIGSARDGGNVGAGIVAGRAGKSWNDARAAFDGLESIQQGESSSEAPTTKRAQLVGWELGGKL